jgi:hypothetical protein
MLTGNGSLPDTITSSFTSGWATGRTPIGGFAVTPIRDREEANASSDWRSGITSEGCPSCEQTERLCDDCLQDIREATEAG